MTRRLFIELLSLRENRFRWNLSFRWAFGNKDIPDTASHTLRRERNGYMVLTSRCACSPRTSCTWLLSMSRESCQLLLNHREVSTEMRETRKAIEEYRHKRLTVIDSHLKCFELLYRHAAQIIRFETENLQLLHLVVESFYCA